MTQYTSDINSIDLILYTSLKPTELSSVIREFEGYTENLIEYEYKYYKNKITKFLKHKTTIKCSTTSCQIKNKTLKGSKIELDNNYLNGKFECIEHPSIRHFIPTDIIKLTSENISNFGININPTTTFAQLNFTPQSIYQIQNEKIKAIRIAKYFISQEHKLQKHQIEYIGFLNIHNIDNLEEKLKDEINKINLFTNCEQPTFICSKALKNEIVDQTYIKSLIQ